MNEYNIKLDQFNYDLLKQALIHAELTTKAIGAGISLRISELSDIIKEQTQPKDQTI